MSLQWSENLSIGHTDIDDQHKALFECFAEFVECCDNGADPEHLRQLFRFLDRYAIEHFRAEEQLMESCGYPDLERQRFDHREFIERLDALKTELYRDGLTVQVLIRTNKALIYWLTEHIREVDMRFGTFLRERADTD